jgi:hypothetical protein
MKRCWLLGLALILTGCVYPFDALHRHRAELKSAQELLSPAAPCPLPCVMGLELGTTTLQQAQAELPNHPWVAGVDPSWSYYEDEFALVMQTKYGIAWSSARPAWLEESAVFDTNYKGNGVARVENLRLYTTLTIAETWLLFGIPPGGNYIPPFDQDDEGACQRAFYAADYGDMQVLTWVTMPLTPASFWNTTVRIQFNPAGSGRYNFGYWVEPPYLDTRHCLMMMP